MDSNKDSVTNITKQEKKVTFWIIISAVLVTIILGIIAIIKKSIGWFVYPFGTILVLGIIVIFIHLIRKKVKTEKTITEIDFYKKGVINNEECDVFAKEIIDKKLEDNITSKNIEIINAGQGNIANIKTPIYHMQGEGYYEGIFHIFINMTNPNRYSILNGVLSAEEIERKINALAEVPYEEEIDKQTIYDPVTGRSVTTEKRKQSMTDSLESRHEQKEEEEKVIQS